MFSQYTRGPRVTGSLSGMRDNTRAGPGLRVRDNTRASYAIPFGYAGQYTRVGYLLGAPRGSLSGSPRGVHEVGVHEVHAVGRDFHAWRVEKARRVDAAWKWRVGMVRRVDAVWIWRVELARRVDAAWKWRVELARRVDAAWKRYQSPCLSLLSWSGNQISWQTSKNAKSPSMLHRLTLQHIFRKSREYT